MDDVQGYAFVVGIVFFVGLALLHYVNQPKCPSCEKRGTLRWRHARNDGGPDGRFKNNPRICSSCGWEG